MAATDVRQAVGDKNLALEGVNINAATMHAPK
jgi:hypothetical protein